MIHPVIRLLRVALFFAALILLIVVLLGGYSSTPNTVQAACAPLTGIIRISSAADGTQANDRSGWPKFSDNGRYIVFTSEASNLVPADTNARVDVFRYDMETCQMVLASLGNNGVQGDRAAIENAVSTDGRYVAFNSYATNFDPRTATSPYRQIYRRDMVNGTTTLVTLSSVGIVANDYSIVKGVSGDGRYVLFTSKASNLVPNDTNNTPDVFVRDLSLNTTTRVSVSSAGVQANGESKALDISADGRYILFNSEASNLVPDDTNNFKDLFLYDQTTRETQRLPVTGDASQANAPVEDGTFSPNGGTITFVSDTSNSLGSRPDGKPDIYLLQAAGTPTLAYVSREHGAGHGSYPSPTPSVSTFLPFHVAEAASSRIVFQTDSSYLVTGDTNGFSDIFLFDQVSGSILRLSLGFNGAQANGPSVSGTISDDGRYVAFTSDASNLVRGDTNNALDIFVMPVPPIPQALTVTSTDDAGPGSFRQAILDANARPGGDRITFSIPGPGVHIIEPLSLLPEITDQVIIDGYTQPGTSPATATSPAVIRIELSGAQIPGSSNNTFGAGLYVTASGCVIRGLAINRFSNGVLLHNNSENVIEGNHLGTDAAGLVGLGNSKDCDHCARQFTQGNLVLLSSARNRIGGVTPAARNVISGQQRQSGAGLSIARASDSGAGIPAGNIIQGNYIGLDATGREALPNTWGIEAMGAPRTQIGGTTAEARNVISGNLLHNIGLAWCDNCTVISNYIGTRADGGKLALNSIPTLVGVAVYMSSAVIGGRLPGTGNVIAEHYSAGIQIAADATVQGSIEGNFIGTDPTGQEARGGAFAGILISSPVHNLTIGGLDWGQGNVIGNQGNGIYFTRDRVSPNEFTHNVRVIGNRIYNNVTQVAYSPSDGLGLNLTLIYSNEVSGAPPVPLDGPTPNDPGDADVGPNGLQNFPTLTSAVHNGAQTLWVGGTLNSKANTAYRIDYYANTACDPSGFGEGEFYLGGLNTTTNAGGNAVFTHALSPIARGAGYFITATATGPEGTSEFSPCQQAVTIGDTVGVFRPGNSTFYLRNSNTTGPADSWGVFGTAEDLPVAGDWNADGIDTIGIYRQSTGMFYLKDSNTTGAPISAQFRYGRPGDLPIAGDWDGDGYDSIGVYRPSEGRLFLRNSLWDSTSNHSMLLGGPGDRPVAGDWDGNGSDSPGVYRPSSARFFLTNTLCNCVPTVQYAFQFGAPGDVAFTGDWNGDGRSGVGVYRQSNARTYLRNALSTGVADVGFVFGIANDRPIAGKWTLPPSSPAPDSAPEFAPKQ